MSLGNVKRKEAWIRERTPGRGGFRALDGLPVSGRDPNVEGFRGMRPRDASPEEYNYRPPVICDWLSCRFTLLMMVGSVLAPVVMSPRCTTSTYCDWPPLP
jgi:hypothetical protein